LRKLGPSQICEFFWALEGPGRTDALHALLPGLVSAKNLDFDPQVVHGNGQGADVRKTNGVLFRRDDCADVPFYTALKETLELGFGVAMVIREFTGQLDARA
jgi:hypothetical protein